jgi:hypothetical protein
MPLQRIVKRAKRARVVAGGGEEDDVWVIREGEGLGIRGEVDREAAEIAEPVGVVRPVYEAAVVGVSGDGRA